MKAAPSTLASVTATTAAPAVAISSFFAEYAKHLHGPGFPYPMLIAASLLTLAYWSIIVLCFHLGRRFVRKPLFVQLAVSVGIALVGFFALLVGFAPLTLPFKVARAYFSVPQFAYLLEQSLYNLTANRVGIAMVLLFAPLLLVGLVFDSQLSAKCPTGENAL
jgi:hypothetical protein